MLEITRHKEKDQQSQQEGRNRRCTSDEFEALIQNFGALAPLVFKRPQHKLCPKVHCGYSSFVLHSLYGKQL